MLRKIALIAAVLMLASLIPHAAAQEEASDAYLRVLNLAPSARDVNVSVDGEAWDGAPVAYDGASEWHTVPAGSHQITVAAVDGAQGQAIAQLDAAELGADRWVTLVIAPGPDGSTVAVPVVEDLSDMPPGSARMTFVNALGQDQQINFLRDETPFVSQLAPLGNTDGISSTSSVSVDSGTYDFSATATQDPQQSFGDLPETEIDEGSAYLLVATDGDQPHLVLHETDRATYALRTGLMEEPGTIIEAARANEMLGPWLDAVERAGLTDLLSGEGPYTVFAPADFAMDEAVSSFGDDSEALATWLRAHIVEGDLKSQEVISAGTLTTLDGGTLDVTTDANSAYVNGAELLAVNIPAINGTIHIIGQEPAG